MALGPGAGIVHAVVDREGCSVDLIDGDLDDGRTVGRTVGFLVGFLDGIIVDG